MTQGSVVADLATLRRNVGAITTADDDLLQQYLYEATDWVTQHVYPERLLDDVVQGAILTQSNRWFQRRRSPEGVAGFGDFGVVRVAPLDPDLRLKLEYAMDTTIAGVG